jgi:uncharacterized membrane protein YkoI
MLRENCIRLICALAVSLTAKTALADEFGKKREDHDVALGALARGELLPLETVLVEVRKVVSGEVVGVELERESGIWVYEIKIIAPGNSMIEAHVDARTAKVIETRGK